MSEGAPQPFRLEVAEHGDEVLLTPRGELDLVTAPDVEGAVLPRLAAGQTVVLDLRGLDFMDSSGIRLLVDARNAAESTGHFAVVLPAEGSEVRRALEVSGVGDVLDVRDAPPG